MVLRTCEAAAGLKTSTLRGEEDASKRCGSGQGRPSLAMAVKAREENEALKARLDALEADRQS